jgi:rubrerythrin
MMDGSVQKVSFGIWRCMICGDVFLTGQDPSHCPFCGAHGEHFVSVDDLSEAPADEIFNPGGELTEREKENLNTSIQVELLNTLFYKKMADGGDRSTPMGVVLCGTYKRLSRIEDEHAGIFCKLLGVEKRKQVLPEDVVKENEVKGEWEADVSASLLREIHAQQLYLRFATETDKPRLKLVWNTIAAVEGDHVHLETQHKDFLSSPPQ